MSTQICFGKSKKSKIKRLSFLPRIGITIDFAGQLMTYRQAPLLETAVNVIRRGLSMKNLISVAEVQLNEIELPKVKKVTIKRSTSGSVRASRSTI